MQFTNIRMMSNLGHAILLLDIDGLEAVIPKEQKPLLFQNGLLFIQPEEVWSRILPHIDIYIVGHFQLTLRNFIRSKTLVSLINEMCDEEVFNRKWSKQTLTEETRQVDKVDLIDQLDHCKNADTGKLPSWN